MNAVRTMNRAALLVSLLAITMYCVAAADMMMFLFAVPGVIGAWIITQLRGGRPAPQLVINPLVALTVGYAGLTAVRQGISVDIFSEFVVLLLILKQLDRRKARDTGQLLTLCVFLTIGAILTSNSLGVGLLMMAMLPVLLVATVSYQLVVAGERIGADMATAPAGPTARRDARRIIGVTVVAALAVSTGIFLIMPRDLGANAFGNWGAASIGQETGFDDEVELGASGLISSSSTPVLDLKVLAEDGRTNIGAHGETYYLRGAVLTEYNRGRWTRPEVLDLKRRQLGAPYGANSPLIRSTMNTAEDYDRLLEITIRNISPKWSHLFTEWRPTQVWLNQSSKVYADDQLGVVMARGSRGKFRYRVAVGTAPSNMPSQQRELARLPALIGSVELQAYAAQLLREVSIEPDPRVRLTGAADHSAARVIEEHLRQKFGYTLDQTAPPAGRDPIDWFLFDHKVGHCEYFASAMAAMLRAVGIDSRVVTGYVATDFNEMTGHYIVRKSNAHAWVEAEIAPDLWYQFDPTPRGEFRRLHQPSPTFWSTVGKWIETAEFAWISTVVSYDTDSRREVLGTWSTDFGLTSWGSDLGDRIMFSGAKLLIRSLSVGLIVFAISMLVGTLAVRHRAVLAALTEAIRRALLKQGQRLRVLMGARPARHSRAVELAQEHSRLLDIFRKLGLPKPAWVPLATHAEAVAVERGDVLVPADIEALHSATEVMYEARFSGRSLSDERRARLIDAIRRLAESARRPRPTVRERGSSKSS